MGVFLAIQALKPAADLLGPGTAGMRAPDRPQDNITQLRNRVEWDPAAIPTRIRMLPDELFATLMGAKTLDPRVVAIGSAVRVGWPELAPLLALIALAWPLALLPGQRGPRGALIFPWYLLLVGAQSAGALEAVRRAWAVIDGYRGWAFLVLLVGSAFAVAGMCACFVGIFPAYAMLHLLMAGLYAALRRGSSVQPV